MWLQNGKSSRGRKSSRNGLVAVAIDKDKGSQNAIKWAIENLLTRGQAVILIHVIPRPSTAPGKGKQPLVGLDGADVSVLEKPTRDLLVTFHCFCTRKDILCFDVVLEDTDIAKAISEYTASAAIESLVLGASRHGFIRRLKTVDIPTSVCRVSPDFCTVYVVSKSKISSVRNACRQAPFTSPLSPVLQKMQEQANNSLNPVLSSAAAAPKHLPSKVVDRALFKSTDDETPHKETVDEILHKDPIDKTPHQGTNGTESFKSPFLARGYNPNMFMDLSESDTDISFISSDRPSTDSRNMDPFHMDSFISDRNSRVSVSSNSSFGSIRSGTKFGGVSSISEYSTASLDNEENEAEMRRLKLELQKTMDMYNTACKEAITAKQKTVELHQWRKEEEKRLEDARMAEEAEKAEAEHEKATHKTEVESAEAAKRVAEIESQKRVDAQKKAIQDSDEGDMGIITQLRYRRYSIEEIEEATEFFNVSCKIGEGGYGPVFKCSLDHTSVAVKVLRPDAVQGRAQFHQEVEVLNCLRHPNMVLLLGACPEYGCLVYEYLANGSLEDRLLRKGNTRPLTWQLRFRIAAEVATGLHFLHQTKPEPLVHRDLKPGNILLDQNYVSKISDVGLARLVPATVAGDVTQYRKTTTAGTLCYIDPEYQQTGMLGVKSDVYSFGIVLMQIITARPAMGLSHLVGEVIEKGSLKDILDPTVPDWPEEETLSFAKLAVQCAELRRKDRPDLGRIVVPELNKMREFGEENMCGFLVGSGMYPSPNQSFISSKNDYRSDPNMRPVYSGGGGGSTSTPRNLSGKTG